MKHPARISALTAICFALACPAYAADIARREISMAASHADDAANSPNIEIAHIHFRHLINCLAGPKGPGFNPQEANPCQGMGEGAIPDTEDPKRKAMLIDTVDLARSGLRADSLTETAATADKVRIALRGMLAPPP